MFGAGTDPLALDQNFSLLADNAKQMINSKFERPKYAKIRCPPVIDHFCRTVAAPIASLYNSLSASSRIALLYSITTKYLYFDAETKGIAYLKIKENQTKLPANKELLKAIANDIEELEFMTTEDNARRSILQSKIEAKVATYERYKQYIYEEIPGQIIAPIRQYWIINILKLIPATYSNLDQGTTEAIIDDTLNEINEDYYVAVKKSIMDYILREDSEKLRIGIMQRFDPPVEYGEAAYQGIMIDQQWVENISAAREKINDNLVSYCQATLSIIKIWAPIAEDSMFDLPEEYADQQNLDIFVNRQKEKRETLKTRIQDNWINEVGNIYKKDTEGMSHEAKGRYFNASAGLMNCQLREFIYASLYELRDFIISFKRDRYLSVEECMKADLDPYSPLQKSFLKIKVQDDGTAICLQDTKIKILDKFEEIIDEVISVSNKLPHPKIDIMRTAKKFYWKIDPDEDEVLALVKSDIKEVLQGALEEVENCKSIFTDYVYLIKEKDIIAAKIRETVHKVSYQAMIAKYNGLIEEIRDKIPYEINMCIAQVDCRDIRNKLIDNCETFKKIICSQINETMNILRGSVNDDVNKIKEELHNHATTADELEALQNSIVKIEREAKGNIEKRFTETVDWLTMLYDNDHSIDQTALNNMRAAAGLVNGIESSLMNNKEKAEKCKIDIQNNLKKDTQGIEERVQELQAEIRSMRDMTNESALNIIERIKVTIENIKKDRAVLNSKEEKVANRITKFELLDQAEMEIKPFADVYTLNEKWKKKKNEWCDDTSVFKLDADAILKEAKKNIGIIIGAISQLDKMKITSSATIKAGELKNDIEKFQQMDKLIISLSAKGMVERHWKEVNRLCKSKGLTSIEWSETCENTLGNAIDADMNLIAEDLMEISARANRELSNFKILEEMEEEWKEVEIKLKDWKDTKTYVIQGDCVDDIQTILEDHIIKTQTMKGSASAKVYEARINSWERDLIYFRDTLDVWLKVQSNWLYLQPIFLSPDIKKELQAEAEKFVRIDKKWRDLMGNTLKYPLAMEVPKNEGLKDQLSDMLTTLEAIQDSLTDYLNSKRKVFPRFYFLSADSLIEVLSEARNPRKIQKFAKILFEGIRSFNFDDDDRILGINSSEGEEILFTECIETKLHAGLVEQWLSKFEEIMHDEVRKFIASSFEEYSTQERHEFVMDRPGMAVLNINMTTWTSDTENAIISNGIKGLSAYAEKLKNELQVIVEVIKQPITKLNRCTLEALIVIDVHNQVVINNLIECEVESITDFDYEAQLRYYWQQREHGTDPQNHTIVKIINSVLDYAYEYLGNSNRLVITPLTDRCYRTLCGAIGLFYGGAPEGPAGTGKTETVKDLAKALARMIVVFNCSENLKFTDMARFFKGLASTGGWSCFDEFNRIQLEVLSVIAQQLQSIQNAVRDGLDKFAFAGTEIRLIRTCNCFITMNPGYAGRAELPDNLKALFRSVAMMVPDYALIAEIRLYSFGFTEASDLARKIVTTYQLCSEQISAQKHYDYGMRAVNSVLIAAGNLRKKDKTSSEDVLVLQAIKEVNEAKFLALDLPLFKGITADLFPKVELPEPDFDQLKECIKKIMERDNLQCSMYFMVKIIELYQMILVRHGLMVVGDTYASKTTIIRVLGEALGLMEDLGSGEHRVQFTIINPKSVTNSQLYGITDLATSEWTDGVLPVKFKSFANDPSLDRKWMWFDGPVDAIWIEDMNTVLDDNKKLCLANGDIFYMSDQMNLIFEPRDLIVASPATVSRCGMVFMEPYMMGWFHLYQTWRFKLTDIFQEYELEDIDIYFETVMAPLIHFFEKDTFELTAPCMPQNIIFTMLKIADQYMSYFREKKFYDSLEHKQRRAEVDKMLVYATVWSAGATVTINSRQKFDTSLRRVCNSADVSLSDELSKKHRKIKLPDTSKVFDVQLVVEKDIDPNDAEKYIIRVDWRQWEDKINKNMKYPKNIMANEIIVETVDQVRYSTIVKMFMEIDSHCLICGPTGTGKTIYIKNILQSLDISKYMTLEIGFSAQSTAMQTQFIIDNSLKKSRVEKGVFGPPPGKKMILFVDDLNMPKQEIFGAQPPIELLRQFLDQGGWYDNDDKTKPFKKLKDIIFVGSMGPPGGGRNYITPRFQRHLHFVSFTSLDDKVMNSIFHKIMEWWFESKGFKPDMHSHSTPIVKATLQIYQMACEKFLPTPNKSHYLFNLRDFAKVIIGVCLAEPGEVPDKERLIKLWIHESWRVFCDRLNSEQDRLQFLEELKNITGKVFGGKFDTYLSELDNNDDGLITTLAEMRGLVWSDVLSPPTARSKPYMLVTDQAAMYKACNDAKDQYNRENENGLNIVLFNFAVEHLLIILRLLKLPGANALLVGVGGSGRKSLATLASEVANNQLIQIELTRTYGLEDWKEDLKKVMISAGKGQDTVFLFSDTQIKIESFIEDVNNLLNNGEVPNLFSSEDNAIIQEITANVAKELEDGNLEGKDHMTFFVETVKKHLHVVLCFSPIGDNFRSQIRMFPSLVNCCTIDWYFEWPEEALLSVAKTFLADLPVEPEIQEKCVEMIQFFHKDTTDWAAKFYTKLQRHYYVTPTSYIEMISQFKSLLDIKKEKVSKQYRKYKNGYDMILDAESIVGEMQKNLKKMVPEIEEATEQTNIKLKETETAKKKVTIVKSNMAEEEAEANKKVQEAQVLSDECEAAMDEVRPIIEKATEALNKVQKDDFNDIKGASKVVTILELTFQALCLIMDPPTVTERNPDTLKNEVNWWATSKKMLMDVVGLVDKMKSYKEVHGAISGKIYKKLDTFFKSDIAIEYGLLEQKGLDAMDRALPAAKAIFQWVVGQYKYYPVYLDVRPKQLALDGAKASSEKALAELAVKQAQLKEVVDQYNLVNKNLEETQERLRYLQEEYEKCKLQLDRAEKLIENLGDEKERWKEISHGLEIDLVNVTGDVLISAGLMSYLGPFTAGFRSEIIHNWATLTLSKNIPGSEHYSFVHVLGNPIEIRAWEIFGLPTDNFSKENAIILKEARRWALCIDPQLQANKWIKKMEKERNLVICKMTGRYMKDIERCIQTGLPLLMENLGVDLDASLNPVLLKQISTIGGTKTIKLGKDPVEYNDDFYFYMTTKLRNPHYLPEVSTKVTLINFMITSEGLSDQLLGTIVSKELPEAEKTKNRLIEEGASNTKQLQELEDKILEILGLDKAKLLDDAEAINVLTASKKKSIEINEKQEDARQTEEKIDEARRQYVGVSQEASCLFFAISDLAYIDPMYQYSLTYFLELFIGAIERAAKNDNLDIRLHNIKDTFLLTLYTNVSRSLFVKDKLLFSFLLCIRIKEFKNEINPDYFNFLLTGAIGIVQGAIPMPKELTWMKPLAWTDICKLPEVSDSFKGLHTNFMSGIKEWQAIYDSSEPINQPFPEPWASTLNDLERLLVLRSIRFDKIKPCIQKYVIDNMGHEYVESGAFSLEGVYKDSTKGTPLIFVLTPGVDPLNSLQMFADSMGRRLEAISLGQGQGDSAINMIDRACNDGGWVILQNCHLAESFMPRLENKCEEIASRLSEIKDDFRMWLSSYPSTEFPSSILQNGIKMTNEPPSGLKENLKNAFSLDEIANSSDYNTSKNAKAYRRLAFSLCFFHSVIQERRKYGPLGWNIPYEFTESDLRISALQLGLFIDKYPKDIPLDALRYLTAECNYGGRVTDDKDRRLITTLLLDYYNDDAYEIDNYELSPGNNEYYIPRVATYEDAMMYINLLPLNYHPNILGFHANASITMEINDSAKILDTLLVCQGGSGAATGGDESEKVGIYSKIRRLHSLVTSLLPSQRNSTLMLQEPNIPV